MEKNSSEYIQSPEERIRELERELSESNAREAALSAENMELRKQNKEILEKNERDSLTGLYNRGFFEEKAGKIIERANHASDQERRENFFPKKTSLIFIDVDNFKFINDNYGHEAGDIVLKEVSKVLKIHTRGDSDMAARLGGEELVVFMPGANEATAKERAEQFRDLIRTFKIKVSSGEFVPVTVSIGVTELQNGETLAQFINRSDKAMYFAKNHGKNKVIAASEIPEENAG